MPKMLATGLISLLGLTGCASGPKDIEIKAAADPVINRDASGQPLSVVVHVYQLNDAGEFSKLTFDMLANGRPLTELLGKDLVEMNEIMLVPGGTDVRSDKIHQKAKHVGIVAFFRQPDQHYWRLLVDADQVRSNGLSFRVQDCYLTLTSPKPSPIPGQPLSPPSSCPANDMQPASVMAGATVASPRQRSTVPNSKRNTAMDAGRQAAESLLTKKPWLP